MKTAGSARRLTRYTNTGHTPGLSFTALYGE